MSIGGDLIVSDWNSKLEKANGEIAELHVKISFQREIVQQLSAMPTDTTVANRILEIRRECLTRALAHKEFIVAKIGKSDDGRLRFRWDQVQQ
jgi:hypothetical protein